MAQSPSNPLQPANAGAADPDDAELVRRCQAGEMGAFDELLTRYRGKVYALIYNMVRNEQDAWDLAQDAFLKAWKAIPRFRADSAFFTWIYRIATNVTLDWIRRKRAEGGVEFSDEIGLRNVEPGARTMPRGEPRPDSRLGHAEVRARIDAALARLSPEHRAVIVLKELDGLQYQEIAEVVGCSMGTVMSRLFYARKKLQMLLKDVYEEL